MADRRMAGDRNNALLRYIGAGFNPDKYVFHMLQALTLTFMVLYTIGTSVPAWYVLEERVTNFSTCVTADRYVEPHVRRYWKSGDTKLLITASLWFVNVKLTGGDIQYSRFVPFVFARDEHFAEETSTGMVIDRLFPRCLTTMLTFTFLGLGVAFTCCSSNRPSRLIYYGLSAVMVVSAITTWVSVAVTTSEKYVLSVGFDLCLQQGALKTSFLLQMVTGSAGILSFILGCILIHLAIMLNTKNTQGLRTGELETGIHQKMSLLFPHSGRSEKHMYQMYDI